MSIIERLPNELKIHIYKEFDLTDILTIRQVNRSLCDTSRDRAIWANFIERQRGELLAPDRVFLEKRIERHSAEELEAAFLQPKRRLASRKTRYSPSSCRLMCRSTSHNWTFGGSDGAENGDILQTLLPGGRWLLAFGLDAEKGIICHHLSAASEHDPGSTFVLVPGREIQRGQILPLDYEIDTTSSYLSFNLIIASTGPSGSIVAWRVRPIFDDTTGCVRSLDAKKITSVPNLPRLQTPIALCGSLMQYCTSPPGSFRSNVLEWSTKVTSLAKPLIVSQAQWGPCGSFLIKLPSPFAPIGPLLLALSTDMISLRTLHAAEDPTLTYSWQGPLPVQLDLVVYSPEVTPPLHQNGFLHFLILTREKTLGVSIPVYPPCRWIGTPKVYVVHKCLADCYPEYGEYASEHLKAPLHLWTKYHEPFMVYQDRGGGEPEPPIVGFFRTTWEWDDHGRRGNGPDDTGQTSSTIEAFPTVSCRQRFFGFRRPGGEYEFDGNRVFCDQFSYRVAYRPRSGVGIVVCDYDDD